MELGILIEDKDMGDTLEKYETRSAPEFLL